MYVCALYGMCWTEVISGQEGGYWFWVELVFLGVRLVCRLACGQVEWMGVVAWFCWLCQCCVCVGLSRAPPSVWGAGSGAEGERRSVCLCFEVGQIALTFSLKRAAGIERSFHHPFPSRTLMRLFHWSRKQAPSPKMHRGNLLSNPSTNRPSVSCVDLWPTMQSFAGPGTVGGTVCMGCWRLLAFRAVKTSHCT